MSALQKVSYLPPINASPTDNSVVHLTLKMAQQIAEECNSEYMQVTYDLAIARIAFGIQCQEAPKFDNVFIHLGGFHIIMSYFKALLLRIVVLPILWWTVKFWQTDH